MSEWTLGSPQWLWLLLALPAFVWLRGRRGQRIWFVPHVRQWWGRSPIERSRGPAVLAVVGVALLVVGMARPQKIEERKQVRQKGYDIVLAIDLSGSMLAEDYEEGGRRINRLQAVKPIIEAFMNRRPGDRIGVVTFGGRAYTLAPLSFDHDWLREQIGRLEVGLVEDGTAVGDALGLAISRLGQAERMKDGLREGRIRDSPDRWCEQLRVDGSTGSRRPCRREADPRLHDRGGSGRPGTHAGLR